MRTPTAPPLENGLAADRSEVYDYDMLDRLSTLDRNTLNAEKTAVQGTPARQAEPPS